MSYNLAFWAGGDDLEPGDVYSRLSDGQHVDGVEAVQQTRVEEAFEEDLAGWTWDGLSLRPPETDPEGTPVFEVFIGEQLVEFIAYGFEGRHANTIISAMHPLGYRLFDPQVDERFA